MYVNYIVHVQTYTLHTSYVQLLLTTFYYVKRKVKEISCSGVVHKASIPNVVVIVVEVLDGVHGVLQYEPIHCPPFT